MKLLKSSFSIIKHHAGATDAAKNKEKTYSSYNKTTRQQNSGLILNYNSIFSCEGLAILLAISQFCNDLTDYIILTDSLSVLKSLENIKNKSPRMTSFIQQKLALFQNVIKSLELVWIPRHVGIPENEQADSLTREVHTSQALKCIPPEDIYKYIKKETTGKNCKEWKLCKYFTHLESINLFITAIHLTQNGRSLLLRFRTGIFPTKEKHPKYGLNTSPNCPSYVEYVLVENVELILFHCKEFSQF
ncbi:hypothetical protein AVEN_241052-1 [Araneus ventricosus]|uniref:RNase H type-1 domain-containing protein n=1 Tax=Araneus ventricosus TaxID=182803 RepID=A0A4Y2VW69_ARAVE|nr:hypothetical protein AVEN_241052-1 [Araneus ventricosus]